MDDNTVEKIKKASMRAMVAVHDSVVHMEGVVAIYVDSEATSRAYAVSGGGQDDRCTLSFAVEEIDDDDPPFNAAVDFLDPSIARRVAADLLAWADAKDRHEARV